MKRYIKSDSAQPIYSERRKFTFDGIQYVAYIRNADNPENLMFDISELHPYDEAEYAWARKVSPIMVNIYQAGKKIDEIYVKDYNQEEFVNPEGYVNTVIEVICEELREYNKKVDPKVDHS